MEIDDPSHDSSAFVDESVDLRFHYRTLYKGTTLTGWVRTHETYVNHPLERP